MLGRKRYPCKQLIMEVLVAIFCLLVFCEYIIYYVVLIQCRWPIPDPQKEDPTISPPTIEEKPVRAVFIADPHLLGSRHGHWFDKLRREWQMYRAFQTVMTIHKPDAVFILGDIFDEGLWSSSTEFDSYIGRFNSIFAVPKDTHLYVLAGNHDIGFHHVITPYLNKRFINGMKSPNVRRISIRGNHFILINSMALEGDSCFLCRPTEIAVNKISKQLKCVKSMGIDCPKNNSVKRYSRPIILQHFPMYRESDKLCNEIDEAPAEIKDIKYRERWECLSEEASEQLLDMLNPRLIIDGHTHHGCRNMHKDDVLEITIPSFSWRNKNNPTLLMGLFTPNNYSSTKCYMPVESTVIQIYATTSILIVLYFLIRLKKKSLTIELDSYTTADQEPV